MAGDVPSIPRVRTAEPSLLSTGRYYRRDCVYGDGYRRDGDIDGTVMKGWLRHPVHVLARTGLVEALQALGGLWPPYTSLVLEQGGLWPPYTNPRLVLEQGGLWPPYTNPRFD